MRLLSPHFSLEEMTRSETAQRLNLDNTPPPVAVDNLRALCTNVLEPLRAFIRRTQEGDEVIHVTSGYRSEALNRAVNGTPASQHRRGEAADINIPGMRMLDLFDMVFDSGVDFDQIILEFNSWVHISYTTRRKNRRSVLYAYTTKTGKTVISRNRKQFCKTYNIFDK